MFWLSFKSSGFLQADFAGETLPLDKNLGQFWVQNWICHVWKATAPTEFVIRWSARWSDPEEDVNSPNFECYRYWPQVSGFVEILAKRTQNLYKAYDEIRFWITKGWFLLTSKFFLFFHIRMPIPGRSWRASGSLAQRGRRHGFLRTNLWWKASQGELRAELALEIELKRRSCWGERLWMNMNIGIQCIQHDGFWRLKGCRTRSEVPSEHHGQDLLGFSHEGDLTSSGKDISFSNTEATFIMYGRDISFQLAFGLLGISCHVWHRRDALWNPNNPH